MTRLELFMERNGVTPLNLARRAGISRQHLYRIRKGKGDPTRATIKALTLAVRDILNRHVGPSELFELGDDPRPATK